MAKRKIISMSDNAVESQPVIKVDLSEDSHKKIKVIANTLGVDESSALDILVEFAKPSELKSNIKLKRYNKELQEIESKITELEGRKRDLLNFKKQVRN